MIKRDENGYILCVSECCERPVELVEGFGKDDGDIGICSNCKEFCLMIAEEFEDDENG